MLTTFRVENFKVFEDTHQIELAPITLLSGVNSAGKSALIQMLLLLKQTLESGPSQALNPARGPFLAHSLGDNFNDFLFARPKQTGLHRVLGPELGPLHRRWPSS